VLSSELLDAIVVVIAGHQQVLVRIAGFGSSYKEASAICNFGLGTIKIGLVSRATSWRARCVVTPPA